MIFFLFLLLTLLTLGLGLRPLWKTHLLLTLFVSAFISLGSLSLYLYLGSPFYPSFPLETRRMHAQEKAAYLERAIQKVLHRLQQHPEDIKGWEVLVSLYTEQENWPAVAQSLEQIIDRQGSTGTLELARAEALIFAAQDSIPEEAEQALKRAQALKSDHFKLSFYLALLSEQKKDFSQARAWWNVFLSHPERTSPFLEVAQTHLQALDMSSADLVQGAEGKENENRLLPFVAPLDIPLN